MPDGKKTPAPTLAEALKADKSFSHFSLGLEEGEQARLAALKVSHEATYDNFGANGALQDEATAFIESLGNGKEEAWLASGVISRLLEQTLKGFGAEAAWVAVRATLPNNDFDIPRWHQDGAFFKSENDEQKKVVAVLKGAPTLFNGTEGHLRDAFRKALRGGKGDSAKTRIELSLLLDPALTSQARAGEGSVFVTGSDRSGLHSEPTMKEARIFVSILPGSQAQIEELRERWNREKSGIVRKKPSAENKM